MINYDLLLEKYKDKITIVSKKRAALAVIEELVDIKKAPIEILTPTHMNFMVEMATNHGGDKAGLQLYTVIKNEKSSMYYREISNDTTYKSYFNEETVYLIVDDELGIMETNSSRLFMDFKINRGITQKDVDEKSTAFMDYLSTLDLKHTSHASP